MLVESANVDGVNLEPASADESVNVTHYGSSSMTLDVSTSAPAMLVLSEVWYPGWRATVNGEAVDILRANGALRALPVPAGDSRVTLDFAPSSWRYGLLAFGVGVALALLILVWPQGRGQEAEIKVTQPVCLRLGHWDRKSPSL